MSPYTRQTVYSLHEPPGGHAGRHTHHCSYLLVLLRHPPPFPTSTATPSTQTAPPLTLGESPLPPHIIRGLGDRSYDKRKNAALDLEQHIKLLVEAKDRPRLEATLILLGDDFCTSTNSNHRKGGLIALAAAAIGLMDSIGTYLDLLLPPILHCFDDPESRVRYYACESLYNVAKVARHSILLHF
ncbi:vac14 family protein [Nannochloropsis oceanica]